MKQITLMLMIAGLITGCGSPELNKEDALQLLKKEKPYPRVVDYEIHRGDPQHATRLYEKGFEDKGLVTIQKTQKIMDMGKPLVDFTEKSKPYLLGTPEEDLKYKIQKIKIAEEDVTEIRAIERDKNTNTAVVHYTTEYKNVTPFAEATPFNMKKKHEYNATFILTDGKWVMQKSRK